MKSCILAVLVVSISSNIIGSEYQKSTGQIIESEDQTFSTQERSYKSDSSLYLKHEEEEEELSTPKKNHFDEKNKKRITKSATTMSVPRRLKKVQIRLDCFELHHASNHDESFMQKVLQSDKERYSSFKELIEKCPQCSLLFNKFINSPQN